MFEKAKFYLCIFIVTKGSIITKHSPLFPLCLNDGKCYVKMFPFVARKCIDNIQHFPLRTIKNVHEIFPAVGNCKSAAVWLSRQMGAWISCEEGWVAAVAQGESAFPKCLCFMSVLSRRLFIHTKGPFSKGLSPGVTRSHISSSRTFPSSPLPHL
jgi:hypothetical protein